MASSSTSGSNPTPITSPNLIPSTVATVYLNTNGPTADAFVIEGNKAYLVFNTPISSNSPTGSTGAPQAAIPFQIDNTTDIHFLSPNYYIVTINIYPSNLPLANLPIYLDVKAEPQYSLIETSADPNAGTINFTVSGVFPIGTILAFWIDAQQLRYFPTVEIIGAVQITNALAQNTAILQRTPAEKGAYMPYRPDNGFISLTPPIAFPPSDSTQPGYKAGLPPQYPVSTTTPVQYPWTEAIIPWERNQPFPQKKDSPGLITLPPLPIPNSPTLINGYNSNYAKFRSSPDVTMACVGYDAALCYPSQPALSVFLRNFNNRGSSQTSSCQQPWEYTNLAKRQYMNALTADKMQFYAEKINTILERTFTEITENGLPFTSTFSSAIIQLLLDIHYGYGEHPQWLYDYTNNFISLLCNTVTGGNIAYLTLMTNCTLIAPRVSEYAQEKAKEIQEKGDQTTLTYWWLRAGMPIEAVAFEAAHNTVAFSQLVNTMYSAVYAAVIPDKTNPIDPSLPPIPDFFQEYKNAKSSSDKLNVVRELYRFLVPNGFSFSHIEGTSTPWITALHMHREIMIENSEGSTLLQKQRDYFTFKPHIYNAHAKANLDGLDGLPVNNDYIKALPTSKLDRETVVDASRSLIPIFSRPIYTPFGLGYRRCAGEVLVYFFTSRALEIFGRGAGYEIRSGTYPNIPVAPYKSVPDAIFAKALA